MEREFVVKLTHSSPGWPFLRQTPGRKGVWGNCRFVVDEEVDRCDFWVVYESLPAAETVRCPAGNTLLLTAEPPSIKGYQQRYLRQFGHILTSHRTIRHPSVIAGQQGLLWMVGGTFDRERQRWAEVFTKDYDELSTIARPVKDRLISVIASDKAVTPGHKLRLDFIAELRKRFGDALDVYGPASGRPLPDKWDGIAPYQYHLVLENSLYPDYWTEKLADAFLGWGYPLYHGCPNVHDYFPAGSLEQVDIRYPETAAARIETVIAERRHETHGALVDTARDLVLNSYSLFPLLARLVNERYRTGPDTAITIEPETWNGAIAKLRRFKNWLTGEGVR